MLETKLIANLKEHKNQKHLVVDTLNSDSIIWLRKLITFGLDSLDKIAYYPLEQLSKNIWNSETFFSQVDFEISLGTTDRHQNEDNDIVNKEETTNSLIGLAAYICSHQVADEVAVNSKLINDKYRLFSSASSIQLTTTLKNDGNDWPQRVTKSISHMKEEYSEWITKLADITFPIEINDEKENSTEVGNLENAKFNQKKNEFLSYSPSKMKVQDSIVLFISVPNAGSLSLEVSYNSTIQEIKKRLKIHPSLPYDDYSLYYSGKPLNPKLTFAHYKIESLSSLTILPNLLGGMKKLCKLGINSKVKQTACNLLNRTLPILNNTINSNYSQYHSSTSFVRLFKEFGNFKYFSDSIKTQPNSRIVVANENLDFKSLPKGGDLLKIAKGSYFVDNTGIVNQVVNMGEEVLLITMPKRFGKSIAIDTLHRFLSMNHYEIEENKAFFSRFPQLEVMRDKKFCQTHQFKYPVIFIDFKNCIKKNKKEVEAAIISTLFRVWEKFKYLRSSSVEDVSANYIEALSHLKTAKVFDVFIASSLLRLSELLYLHHGVKPWILIDEYDAAVTHAFLTFEDVNTAKDVCDLFKEIFSCAFKGNPSLANAVITGCLRIVKTGMLSQLNNVVEVDITHEGIGKYYGVGYSDMELLFELYGVNDESDKKNIREWYNGFMIGGEKKYDIWSAVNLLSNYKKNFKYENYRAESELLNHIFKLVVNNPSLHNTIKKRLCSVFTFKKLKLSTEELKLLNESTTLNKFESEELTDVMFSFFHDIGYITIVDDKDPENMTYKFTNYDIQNLINEKIINGYNIYLACEVDYNLALEKNLLKLLESTNDSEVKKNMTSFFNLFEKEINKNSFIRERPQYSYGVQLNEHVAHSVLDGIFLRLAQKKNVDYKIQFATDSRLCHFLDKNNLKVDKQYQENRPDISAIFQREKRKHLTGFVFELKLDKSTSEAIKQIKESGYYLAIRDCPKQFIIGVNINSKNKEDEVYLSIESELGILLENEKNN